MLQRRTSSRYEIVNVNGRASYTAKPRRARRGNQFAIVIAAVVLLVFGPMNMPFIGLGKIETSSDKRLGGSRCVCVCVCVCVCPFVELCFVHVDLHLPLSLFMNGSGVGQFSSRGSRYQLKYVTFNDTEIVPLSPPRTVVPILMTIVRARHWQTATANTLSSLVIGRLSSIFICL